jgi:4-hydroxy-4-methyl-2-oxoglutarate aldolase
MHHFGAYYQLLDEMSQLDEPSVLVIKTLGSRPKHECVMGNGMAKELHSCGCVGVVTDGGVRDVSDLLKIPFAAHSKGITVHHSSIRFAQLANQLKSEGLR